MTLNTEITKQIVACNGLIKKYDNGILHFCKNKGVVKSSPEGTYELYQALTTFQEGHKTLMLLSLKGLQEIEMSCRNFLMHKLPEISTGIAFVIDDNPVIRSQFAMSSYLRQKTVPVEMFHTEKEAFDWLSSL